MSENCSDNHTVVRRQLAPTGPEWGPEHVGLWMDKHETVSVLNVTWKIKADGKYY